MNRAEIFPPNTRNSRLKSRLQLSVIIVNYNVKFFLEQCLHSVVKATHGLLAEIFVVDNASADGSLEYLQPRFPSVRFVCNAQNTGFAKANNQALALAGGKFILFLNPDTILAEDTLHICLRFMEADTGAGACGVRMIDGSGRFLPESKRGFPTVASSLWKFSGLAALFPRSARFAHYYLGHLPELQNHPVEVLAGAFLLARKKVLDQTGGFDEAFFMYGEDIDLSYRMLQTGHQNYYLAETTILHFKGESTSRHDVQTVRHFWGAMEIFARKHYPKRKARLLSVFIRMLIRFKLALPGAPEKIPALQNSPLHAWMIGDPASREEARYLLNKDNTPVRRLHQADADTDLAQLCRQQPVQEIIFCEGLLSFAALIGWMQTLSLRAAFRVHAKGSSSIAGSDRKATRGSVVS